MIREAVATGRTVDAAIDNACAELNIPREEVEFEIIDLPRRGFLGLTQTPAKVRVWKEFADEKPVTPPPAPRQEAPKQQPVQQKPRQEQPAQQKPRQEQQAQKPRQEQQRPPVQKQPRPKPAPQEEVSDRPLSEQAAAAKQYLADILAQMGLGDAVLQVNERDGAIHIRLVGDENGAAIGRRGETLDALQYLTNLAANRTGGEDYTRITLDSGNYRDKRRRTLEQLAKRLANNAIKTGKATTLEPMNPYERRIIHAAVSEVEGAVSSSVGEEPNRCVVISSTGTVAPRSGDDNRRSDDRRNGGNRGGFKPRTGAKPGAPRSNNGGQRRDNRREKPEPYKESSKREVAPSEAQNQPLYGKIEL